MKYSTSFAVCECLNLSYTLRINTIFQSRVILYFAAIALSPIPPRKLLPPRLINARRRFAYEEMCYDEMLDEDLSRHGVDSMTNLRPAFLRRAFLHLAFLRIRKYSSRISSYPQIFVCAMIRIVNIRLRKSSSANLT